MDEWADRKANVRDILTHVSGLPRCVGFGGFEVFFWCFGDERWTFESLSRVLTASRFLVPGLCMPMY